MVPTWSAIPAISAGAVVSIARASASSSPFLIAIRSSSWNFRPPGSMLAVSAIVAPSEASSSRLGFVGACSQAIIVSSSTESALPTLETSGLAGNRSGTIMSRPRPAMPSSHLNSIPLPIRTAGRLNSVAISSARKCSSSCAQSNASGTDASSSGEIAFRGFDPSSVGAVCACQSASISVCRISATAPGVLVG
jgi:hypothetical protein